MFAATGRDIDFPLSLASARDLDSINELFPIGSQTLKS